MERAGKSAASILAVAAAIAPVLGGCASGDGVAYRKVTDIPAKPVAYTTAQQRSDIALALESDRASTSAAGAALAVALGDQRRRAPLYGIAASLAAPFAARDVLLDLLRVLDCVEAEAADGEGVVRLPAVVGAEPVGRGAEGVARGFVEGEIAVSAHQRLTPSCGLSS